MRKIVIEKNLFEARIFRFLSFHPFATIYHHPAWLRAIEKSFNYKANYLVELDGENEIKGLLPFIEFNNKSQGKN